MFLNMMMFLLKVDGIRNPKIQSIYLESFPIYKACFSADGEQVIATGTHHKMFYVYDMMAGSIIPVHQVRGMLDLQVFSVLLNRYNCRLDGI